MRTTTSSRRNSPYVFVGFGIFAPMAWVGLGCSPGGASDVADAAGGTDDGGDEELARSVEPMRTCVDLVADQAVRAGTVCMTIEPHLGMNVTYTTIGGWELTEAQLAAAASMTDIPIDDKGNSQLDQFEFDSGDITGAISHTFVVPLRNFDLPEDVAEGCDPVTAYLAAHATLRKRNRDGAWRSEIGWGHAERSIDDGNWAPPFTVSLECDARESPQLETCETAFAKGDASTCFIGADFDGDGSQDGIDRWGWSNGPLAPGTGAAWPVYAAAGQCDVGSGTRIGSLSVSYDLEGNAQVVFDRIGDVVLDEEHLHVGTEPLPRDEAGRPTIAPKAYPIVRELDDVTHTEHLVGGLEGDIYVAYHAVACGTLGHSSRAHAR